MGPSAGEGAGLGAYGRALEGGTGPDVSVGSCVVLHDAGKKSLLPYRR